MKHRVKNSLATVMAIARQTFRDSSTGARDTFDARIQALASAHDLLTLRNWDGALVEAVVESALALSAKAIASAFGCLARPLRSTPTRRL